jgi:hypothetical protein
MKWAILLIAGSLAYAQPQSFVGIGQVPGGGSGGSTASIHVLYKAICQNFVGGSGFDLVSAIGSGYAPVSCDSVNGGLDAYHSFTDSGGLHIQGHQYLPSTFTDGIIATIGWNSTATTGAVTWSIAAQCTASGAKPSTGGYGSYTTFASSTASGTASGITSTTGLSWTTGCTAGQTLWFDIQVNASTLAGAAAAQLHWLDLKVTQ